MLNWITSLMVAVLNDRKGISAMEYAVLAGVVLTAVVAALTNFSSDLSTAFNSIGSYLVTKTTF